MSDGIADPIEGCCGDVDRGSTRHGNPGFAQSAAMASAPKPGTHIACHHVRIFCSPPDSQVFWGKDGSYRGVAQPDRPVEVRIWISIKWDDQKREWTYFDAPPFINGRYEVTMIARKPGYSDSQSTLWIPSSDFFYIAGSPEELTSSGQLGKCPLPDAGNTSLMTVNLQKGDGVITEAPRYGNCHVCGMTKQVKRCWAVRPGPIHYYCATCESKRASGVCWDCLPGE